MKINHFRQMIKLIIGYLDLLVFFVFFFLYGVFDLFWYFWTFKFLPFSVFSSDLHGLATSSAWGSKSTQNNIRQRTVHSHAHDVTQNSSGRTYGKTKGFEVRVTFNYFYQTVIFNWTWFIPFLLQFLSKQTKIWTLFWFCKNNMIS